MHQHRWNKVSHAFVFVEEKKMWNSVQQRRPWARFSQIPAMHSLRPKNIFLAVEQEEKHEKCGKKAKQIWWTGKKKSTWPKLKYTKGLTGNCELTIGWLLEVNVGIPQWAARDDVATDADWQDGTDGRELLEKHRFGDVTMQVSDVKRSHCVAENNTKID